MEPSDTETTELARRWRAGDNEALEALVERELPWILSVVRRRLGARLRRKAESVDIVQEVLLEFLKYGPRVIISDRAHFRALLARIAENVIRGESDRFRARRRALSRERQLGSASALNLDLNERRDLSPSQEAAQRESEELVRLALELVDVAERHLIELRDFEGLSFRRLGEEMGISEDAARMRYHRAVFRLTDVIAGIRAGKLGEVLEQFDDPPESDGKSHG